MAGGTTRVREIIRSELRNANDALPPLSGHCGVVNGDGPTPAELNCIICSHYIYPSIHNE